MYRSIQGCKDGQWGVVLERDGDAVVVCATGDEDWSENNAETIAKLLNDSNLILHGNVIAHWRLRKNNDGDDSKY